MLFLFIFIFTVYCFTVNEKEGTKTVFVFFLTKRQPEIFAINELFL